MYEKSYLSLQWGRGRLKIQKLSLRNWRMLLCKEYKKFKLAISEYYRFIFFVGLVFAMMSMKVILATILRKYILKMDKIRPVKDIQVGYLAQASGTSCHQNWKKDSIIYNKMSLTNIKNILVYKYYIFSIRFVAYIIICDI